MIELSPARTIAPVLAAFILVGAIPEIASQNLTRIGHWGDGPQGSPVAVAIDRGHALVAEETGGMLVYRLEDGLRRPVRAGRFTPDIPSKVSAFTVTNHIALLAGDRLTLVDLTEITSPSLAGVYTPETGIIGLVATEQFCFITTQAKTLEVIDISQPANPTRVATLTNLGGAVLLRDKTLFVAFTNVVAVDVRIPAEPRVLAFAPLHYEWSEIRTLALHGNILIALNQYGFSDLFDVAEVARIRFVKTGEGPYKSLAPFEGGFLGLEGPGWNYLKGPDLDIVGGVINDGSFSERGRSMALAGSMLYITSPEETLLVFDLSDPALVRTNKVWLPDPVGRTADLGDARKVALNGDVAYLADGKAGLRLIDISDPRQPALLGTFPTDEAARQLIVNGYTAFLSAGTSVLIIDVSSPSRPTLLATLSLSDVAEIVELRLNRTALFVGDRRRSPRGNVYDVSDPSRPVEQWQFDIGSWLGFSAAANGDFLYVFSGAGLLVADLQNRTTKFHGWWLADSYPFFYTGLVGDLLYVGRWSGRRGESVEMGIYNISLPGEPNLLFRFYIPGDSWGMSVDGKTGIVAAGARGLELYDFPVAEDYAAIMAAYDTPGFAHDAVRQGDLVYVADGPAGLQIFRQSENSLPRLAITGGAAPKIQLTGFVGRTYEIEFTNALEKNPVSWNSLLTVELTEPSQTFDGVALPSTNRAGFYRARNFGW